MEAKKSMVSCRCRCRSRGVINDDDCGGTLPGFRFHPTDEELVGFYLKRKVEKRPLHTIEMIIKHIDIYKHDPWDLAKTSSSMGDKEWYFYCKRGRKYRNSIRPNRVTGSGFWKATGIDRPIYSNGGEGHPCIGLKKSLVYYRGSAGKGSKTDWMMHEFRLPSDLHGHQHEDNLSINPNPKATALEAEIWTLCRIFKRNKKHTPDWREISAKRNAMNTSSKTNSNNPNNNHEHYISFTTNPELPTRNNSHNSSISTIISDYNSTITVNHNVNQQKSTHLNHIDHHDQNQQQWIPVVDYHTTPPSYSSSMNLAADEENEWQSFGYYEQNSWDDLMSVMECAVRAPLL